MTRPSHQPITLFMPSLNGGGAERVFVNLANEFTRQSVAPVHLVVARGGGPLLEDVAPEVRIVDLGRRRVASAVLPLFAYLRRERPQALLCTMSEANVVALLAWQMADRPCRIAIRQTSAQRPHEALAPGLRQAVLRLMMRRLYPKADTLVVIADDVLTSLRRQGIKPPRCCHIGNPVTPAPSSSSSWAPELPDGARLICSVGRLVEAKGYDLLLEAFSRIDDSRCHLAILGEGPMRASLLNQAHALGIADRLHLPGYVRHPQGVIARSDLFVSSSRREGFPNVLLDALAAGVPIVATDCPGASADILEHGRHGLVVPPEDVEALVHAMELGLKDPPGSCAARQARSTDFALSVIAQRYLREALNINEQPPIEEALAEGGCSEVRA